MRLSATIPNLTAEKRHYPSHILDIAKLLIKDTKRNYIDICQYCFSKDFPQIQVRNGM